MRFFAGPTLLVIDELGYLLLPAEAASALFQVVSQRYLKTSIVITTNPGVGASSMSAINAPRYRSVTRRWTTEPSHAAGLLHHCPGREKATTWA